MCGFTGFLDVSKKNFIDYQSILNQSSKDIFHRGPDESKNLVLNENGIYLNFQRLSFLDLSENGSQPMFSKSKRYILLFNGEIYNYLELKNKIPISDNSDSRILLEYIEFFGISNFLQNVDGMFSIVLIDLNLKKVFFISDFFGQKPLYYFLNEDLLYFSSDLRTSKNHPNLSQDIDNESINLFFRKNYIPAPYTIYKNFKKITPNQIIEISFNNKIKLLNKNNYFHLSKNRNKPFIKNDLKKLLNESVYEHLNSDVEIGTFLSSGVDSSLITSIASKKNHKIKSFTLSFKENKFDESVTASKIAQSLKIENIKVNFDDNNLEEKVFETANIFSEPFSDSSQIPYHELCRYSSNYVKGVLSGDGGDELFGGYDRHIYAPLFFEYSNYKLILIFLKIIKKYNLDNIFSYFGYIYPGEKINRLINALIKKDKFSNFYNDITSHHEFHNIQDKFNISFNNNFISDEFDSVKELRLRTMLYDLFYYLPNDLMVKSDRSSMYNGLEVRSPLLSKKIYNYVDKIDPNYHFKFLKKKVMLKSVLSDYLPAKFINNNKKGFVAPINKWLRENLNYFLEKYTSKQKLSHGLFNEKLITENISDFKKGKNNHYAIWDLLIFQIWFDRYHN